MVVSSIIIRKLFCAKYFLSLNVFTGICALRIQYTKAFWLIIDFQRYKINTTVFKYHINSEATPADKPFDL